MQRYLFGRVLEQTRHQIVSRRVLTLVPSLSHPVPVPVATFSLPINLDNINPNKSTLEEAFNNLEGVVTSNKAKEAIKAAKTAPDVLFHCKPFLNTTGSRFRQVLGTWRHSRCTNPATLNRVREIHDSSGSETNPPKSKKSSASSNPKKTKSSVSKNPKRAKSSVTIPRRTKFQKHHRGRVNRGISSCRIISGSYALRTLEPGWITSRQIEAGRRAMIRHIQRGEKVRVRVFADKSVTARPTETRMGRGKGAPAFWVAVVKPGKVIYEMGGVSETIARKAIKIAASKLPLKTHFITSNISL